MSKVSATDVAVVYADEGPAHSLVAIQAAELPAEGLVEPKWYPLIPIGRFTHLSFGDVTITRSDAAEYVAHFQAGLPFSGGVPIDEDGAHRQQAAAFGYIEELEVREDAVWGLVALSSIGQAAIADRQYRYLSPSFNPAGRPFTLPDGTEYDNLLIAAALCNRPFFTDQPGLLAATAGYEFESIEEAQARADAKAVQATDAEVIAVTDEQKAALRTAYVAAKGEVTDDEWAALIAELEDEQAWQAFAEEHGLKVEAGEQEEEQEEQEEEEEEEDQETETVTLSQEDFDKLKTDAEKSKDLETKVGDLGKELETVQATTGTLQAQLEKARLEETIRATEYGGKVPAPAAVDVVVALQMNPCAETVKATLAHLAENDGALALVELGERPAISATDGSGGNEDLWLEEKGLDPMVADSIRATAAQKDCSFQDAYKMIQRAELGIEA